MMPFLPHPVWSPTRNWHRNQAEQTKFSHISRHWCVLLDQNGNGWLCYLHVIQGFMPVVCCRTRWLLRYTMKIGCIKNSWLAFLPRYSTSACMKSCLQVWFHLCNISCVAFRWLAHHLMKSKPWERTELVIMSKCHNTLAPVKLNHASVKQAGHVPSAARIAGRTADRDLHLFGSSLMASSLRGSQPLCKNLKRQGTVDRTSFDKQLGLPQWNILVHLPVSTPHWTCCHRSHQQDAPLHCFLRWGKFVWHAQSQVSFCSITLLRVLSFLEAHTSNWGSTVHHLSTIWCWNVLWLCSQLKKSAHSWFERGAQFVQHGHVENVEPPEKTVTVVPWCCHEWHICWRSLRELPKSDAFRLCRSWMEHCQLEEARRQISVDPAGSQVTLLFVRSDTKILFLFSCNTCICILVTMKWKMSCVDNALFVTTTCTKHSVASSPRSKDSQQWSICLKTQPPPLSVCRCTHKTFCIEFNV